MPPKDKNPVKVGAKIGVTVNLGDYNSLKCEFWHERIARDDSVESIKKAAALVDEFNEEELQRYVRKYKRLVRATTEEREKSSRRRRV